VLRWGLASLCALAPALISGCGFWQFNQDLVRMGVTADVVNPESLNGVEITYYRAGDLDEPRVIFVHGTPGSAGSWARYLRKPVEGFEAVALDRPGFGRSGPGRALPALDDQTAAIEPLLEPRDGRWPILVGHSLGGPIVANVAAAHPDRVRALVIVAGALDPSLERVHAAQHVGDSFPLCLLLPRALRHANRELIPLEGELRRLERRLAAVRCPVVILHGTEDSLVPYENVDFMEHAFENATAVEIVRLEGWRHFLPWTVESVVRDAIRRAERLAETGQRTPVVSASPSAGDAASRASSGRSSTSR